MTDQGPIAVPASAGPDQLASAFRSLLVAIGAYGAGKGWFTADIAGALVTVFMIGGPMLWSQFKVCSQHARLVTVAEAAPDSVATVGK